MVDGGREGTVFVVNVWGSWCPPCIEETPALQKAREQVQGEGLDVEFIGLDKMESPETGLAFQKANKVTYPSLAYDGGVPILALQGKATATPSTLVLDQQGRIAARVSGRSRRARSPRSWTTCSPEGLTRAGTPVNADLATGSLLLASVVALAAGLVSFASPCVLPLVPGFLGYVTGLSDESLERRSRGRLVVGALLFVLGFTVVFLIAAAALSAVGVAFREHQSALLRIGGAVVIVMGLLFLGARQVVCRPARLAPTRRPAGAPLLGAAFAVGWSPCWGPTLGAIQAMAAPISAEAGRSGGASRSASLLDRARPAVHPHGGTVGAGRPGQRAGCAAPPTDPGLRRAHAHRGRPAHGDRALGDVIVWLQTHLIATFQVAL